MGDEHTIQYIDHVLIWYTWRLYNLINQCHPNKFNLKSNKILGFWKDGKHIMSAKTKKRD